MVNRRAFLTQSANGFGAVALSAMLSESERSAAQEPLLQEPAPLDRKYHFPPKAKSVIFLYMDGGPSQVDTFDPKP